MLLPASVYLRNLNIVPEIIALRMKQLQPVNMRLELKKGINHCSIINDSYSADLSSLEIALNFLDQQSSGSSKRRLSFPIFCKVQFRMINFIQQFGKPDKA